MENNRNWAGWAALVLAGLALFVALSGRLDIRVQIPNDTQGATISVPVQPIAPPQPLMLPTVVPPAGVKDPAQMQRQMQEQMDQMRQQMQQEFGADLQAPDSPVPPQLD